MYLPSTYSFYNCIVLHGITKLKYVFSYVGDLKPAYSSNAYTYGATFPRGLINVGILQYQTKAQQ